MKKNILRILVIVMCVFLFSGTHTHAEEISKNEITSHSDTTILESDTMPENNTLIKKDDVEKESVAEDNVVPEEDAAKDNAVPEEDAVKDNAVPEEDVEEDNGALEKDDIEESDIVPEFTDSILSMDSAVNNVLSYGTEPKQMMPIDYVQGYVERCYQYILGRSVDPSGLTTWTQKILSGYGGAEIVKDLIVSDEFVLQEKTDEEVIEILYQAMLGREAETSGKAYWVELLNDGVSYSYIIKGFASSQEFKDICVDFGIDTGAIEITEARDKNANVTAYIMRSYKKILGRKADVGGLNLWTNKIFSGYSGAEIVKDLVFSEEFQVKSKTNEEVVEIIFQTMLGRTADSEEKEIWLNHLRNGCSYRYIISCFATSQEFNNICVDYEIIPGVIPNMEARDENLGVTGYVTRCYRKILGREADIAGLNYWCNMILHGGMRPKQIAFDFVFSSEYIDKNLNNEQYIEMLYEVLLGRRYDYEGKIYWLSLLENKITKEEAFWGFADSLEFEEILFSYGLSDKSNVKIINAIAKFELVDKKVEFQFDAQLNGDSNSFDNYYLMLVENYTNDYYGEPIARIEKAKDISYRNDDFDKNKLKEITMNRVALAVRLNDGNYRLVSEPISVSNIEAIASNNELTYKGESKKGLQGVSYANYQGNGEDILDARSSNTKHTLFNLDLATIVSTSAKSGYTAYTYKGNTYYFSELTDLKANIRSLNSGYQQYLYGNNGTTPVCVSLCLLLGYNSENSYLIDPAARTPEHAYYMLNVREERARETFEALFLYLGEIFGQSNCYVTNWILGNEINSSKAWNYSGSLDFDTYMECYTTAFRLLYSGVKTQKTGNTVSISLDNGWTAAPDTYAGKTTLDVFAQRINEQNPNIDWSIAYHPYSYPLTRVDFWNDYSYTTDSLATKYISMRNINVLTDYVSTLENTYGKKEGTIRVLLTEQGYSYGGGAKLQAQAIARSYYIAEFNDRIDAFIIRTVADDIDEMSGGLYLGLMDVEHNKRISFYVYEYMDSDIDQFKNVSAVGTVSPENYSDFNVAKEIVCGTTWSNFISGFDRTKLEAIK